MFSLIYVSSSVSLMDGQQLLEILRASHKNNAEQSVTGMLLYKGGNFMQVLEGPKENVIKIFEKIQNDPRHKDIMVIAEDEIDERQFSEWKMAFANLDDESVRSEPAYSEFLQDEFTAQKYRETPQLAYVMLLSFRETLA